MTISANQNALGNLLNTGLGAAQSTANIATGLGQAIAGQNTMTGANLSNAYLQQGNVMSNLQSNLGTLAFQRALSGVDNKASGLDFGVMGGGSAALMGLAML